MKFLFDNESFSFANLRTAGFAAHGEADLGQNGGQHGQPEPRVHGRVVAPFR
jgi:hypothetical protein